VQPADDFIFDPAPGPDEPADSIGLNAALGSRLSNALAALRQGAGTPLSDPESPPIAVQTQSFVSGVFSPDKFSSLTLLISALRDAQGRTTGGSPAERDFHRRLFLVPNAHVSHLHVADVFRDGALRPGDKVTAIELFAEGTRRHLPVKPGGTVVLALGCFESTRLALESFPAAPDRGGGRNLMAHLRFDFPFQLDRQAFAQWVQQNTGKTLRDQLQIASFHLQADSPDGRFHLQGYGSGIDTTAQGPDNPEGLLYRMIPEAAVAQRLAEAQETAHTSQLRMPRGRLADAKAPLI
jgi:hypothetical protein